MRFIAALFAWLVFLTAADADERILSFDSVIEVLGNSDLRVTETITVNAEGHQIRRGIYRDFPTDYKLPNGRSMRVGFDVKEVSLDGAPEDYHTERLSNGVRVYFGSSKRFVSKGVHTYRLIYETSRQIGYFDDHDELYWNVTGNGWDFPINAVRAVVQLPQGARPADFAFYTGPQGARGSDATSYGSGAEVTFETTRILRPREGLTIVVGWPKGYVSAPSELEKTLSAWGDLRQITVAVMGLLAIVVYYVAVWLRVGRDPDGGAIYPRYTPVRGLAPAATRFIANLGFDQKGFAAALVSLAVKGAIRLNEPTKGDFVVEKVGEGEGLSAAEKALLRSLFPGGETLLALKQKEHRTVRSAISALKSRLSMDYERVYFVKNRAWIIPGVMISLAVLGGLAFTVTDPEPAVLMSLWIAGWSVVCYSLFMRARSAWRAAAGSVAGLMRAIISTLFAVPFFAGLVVGGSMLAILVSWPVVAAVILVVATNLLFVELLKAPTLLGRRVIDAIEGFKLYLSVAEKDRLDWAHEPERTPELFEKYLPYAIALDVETRWGEKFADVLARAAADGSYQPRWYSGAYFSPSCLGDFPAALGAGLSSAVASASQAPGSSSGFGGGGSSGGGGGGGGGGGW